MESSVVEGIAVVVPLYGAFDAADARALVAAARQLQERLPGFEPMIVPKCAAALAIIPEEIVVGYPIGYSEIQAGDFSRPADWAERRIHILGGTPPNQWAAMQDLTGCGHHGTTLADFGAVDPDPNPRVDIVGLDWNGLYRMATLGKFWHHDSPHWRAADHCSLRATVRRGLWHIREFWRERGVWPTSTPVDERGSGVIEGPVQTDSQVCMGCGHDLDRDRDMSDYELVRHTDGETRPYCTASCRARSEHYDHLEPDAETPSAHHLWTGTPDCWDRAM